MPALIERISAERERGDYAQALALAQSAWARGERDGRLALYALRAGLAAGCPKDAAVWLERGLALSPDPVTEASLRLEGAYLGMLERMDLRGALETLATVEHTTGALALSTGDRAELRWLSLRTETMAAVYREIPPEQTAHIEPDLAETSAALLAADRTSAGLSAAYTLADRKTPADAALAAFDALMALAERKGRPGLAADAALRRAELLRIGGAPAESVEAEIRRAEARFAAANHRHGPIDAARARAELAIDRDGAPLDDLAACATAYLEAGCPRGAISVLMDLSTHAHRRGDSAAAARFGQALAELADRVGMGMQRTLADMREADLAMRRGLHALARDRCDAALAQSPPRVLRANLLVLRASSLSLAGDRAAAIRDKRAALKVLEDLGADDLASELIPSLATDIAATRDPDDLREADELLVRWIARDRTAGDWAGTVAKLEVRADLRIFALLRPHPGPAAGAAPADQGGIQTDARAILDEATTLAETRLAGATQALRISGLIQRRATLASLAGDDAGLEQALTSALERFERAGYGFESANCRYLLGCTLLNRVNASADHGFVDLAGRAERALSEALAFYDGAGGMRRPAADTRHKLALLLLNVQDRLVDSLALPLRESAGRLLREAADDLDALRRAYGSSDPLEARTGKAALAESAAQIVRQALRLYLLIAPDWTLAWRWVVGWKSRALADLLGAAAETPETLDTELAEHPDLARMVADERALCDRLARAGAGERLDLTARLDALRARMQGVAALRDYVELRSGAVADEADLSAALAGAPAPCAAVDWAALGDRLWIFVARPGAAPVGEEVPLAVSRVERFVADYLSPESFRVTLAQDPEALEELAPLVAPLVRLAAPGEQLLFCPTGALHGVPLHALPLGREPALVRHPIAYCPSLGILRLCRLRPASLELRRAAVFGDPGADREGANALARRLAQALQADFVVGTDATAERLDAALSEAALVHFQGHARHCREDPLGSYLELARGARFEARRLFAPPRIRTRTVVLGACESAAAVLQTGDEQLGLIPAFLVAGARTLIAAKWPVYDQSAAAFMDGLYAQLLAGRSPIEALREAALALYDDPSFQTPYHWAAFALYGDPWGALAIRSDT